MLTWEFIGAPQKPAQRMDSHQHIGISELPTNDESNMDARDR